MKKYPLFILFFILLLLSPLITSGERPLEEESRKEEVTQKNTATQEEIITRGEFSILLAQALDLTPTEENPFRDLDEHPKKAVIASLHKEGILQGYPEGNFLPHIQLTKGEAAAITARVLELDQDEHRPRLEAGTHWAEKDLLFLSQLGLIRSSRPHEYMIKEEAEELIQRIKDLTIGKGTITEIYPISQKIAIQTDRGRELIDSSGTGLLFRNNRPVSFEELRIKDRLFLLQDTAGNVEYLRATGILHEKEIAMELSHLLGGLLSWQEVEALASGNWSLLGDRAFSEIEEYLKREGLTPNEIKALMSTDWDTLSDLGKIRLIEALSMETGVPKDLIQAIIHWNWEEILEITQLELLQLLVEEILDPSYLNM